MTPELTAAERSAALWARLRALVDELVAAELDRARSIRRPLHVDGALADLADVEA